MTASVVLQLPDVNVMKKRASVSLVVAVKAKDIQTNYRRVEYLIMESAFKKTKQKNNLCVNETPKIL